MLWLQQYFSDLRPWRVFVLYAVCFGLLFLVLNPPFQAPDEVNHFYRSYQISGGALVSEKLDHRIGGSLPVSLRELAEPFCVLRWKPDRTLEPRAITDAFKIPLNPKASEFMDFPNTGLYPAVCYLPQAFGIGLGRLFGLPPLVLFYLARLCVLLFWITGIYYAIRITPVFKWMFTFAALLPMSVFINGSLSADVAANTIAFVYLAFVLRLIYRIELITPKHVVCLSVLCFLVVSAKAAYAPLLLTLLLIPAKKFSTARRYAGGMALMAFVSAATVLSWAGLTSGLYLSYSEYNASYREFATIQAGADAHLQLNYILSHGTYMLHVLLNTVTAAFPMYFSGYIGTFGWLDTRLPAWFIAIMYLLIVAVLACDGGEQRITIKQRLLFLGAFLFCIVGLLMLQYVIWDR